MTNNTSFYASYAVAVVLGATFLGAILAESMANHIADAVTTDLVTVIALAN